jgi:hypothetical protein
MFGQFVFKEYSKLHNGPGCFLFLSVFVGAFLAGYLVAPIVISLKFGTDAYFKGGLRLVPHKGLTLTNGRMMAPPYQFLFIILEVAIIILWAAVSLAIAIGMNRLVDAFRDWRSHGEPTRDQIIHLPSVWRSAPV